MIAFASSLTKPEVYARCAGPGIKRAAEPDSVIEATPGGGSIFRSYNAVLDRFAERDDLEALVLVHQDAEIVDHRALPVDQRHPERSESSACWVAWGPSESAASPGGRPP